MTAIPRFARRVLLPAVLAACASLPAQAQSADPLRVGFIGAVTGYGSFIGDPELKAARLRVKLANQAGGINGRKVDLVVHDSEGSPEKAVIAMKRLIQDKVSGVVGPDFSSTVRAVIPLVEEAKMPTYVMTPVIKPGPGSFMFAAYPIQEYAYEQQLVWFSKKQGLNKLGVLASTDTTGQEGVKFLREIAQRLKIELVVENFNIQDVDVTPQLLNLRRRGSQGVMAAVSGKPFAVVAKGMKQLGMTIPLLASTGAVTKTLGDLLKGIEPETLLLPTLKIFVADQLPKSDPQRAPIEALRKVYRQEYNDEPDLYAAVGWDSTDIMLRALGAAKGDATKTRDYLEKLTNYVGAVCTINMKPDDHHGCTKDAYVMVLFKDGKFVLDR